MASCALQLIDVADEFTLQTPPPEATRYLPHDPQLTFSRLTKTPTPCAELQSILHHAADELLQNVSITASKSYTLYL